MISLHTTLAETELLTPALVKPLTRLGLLTVGDLLTHYPKRHEDRNQFDQFPQSELPNPICIRGLVEKTSLKRFGGYKKMFDATLADSTGHALSMPIVLRWFNLHYVQHMIAIGLTIIAYGRPRLRGKLLTIEHPEFEVIEDDADVSLNLDRLTPIYPATEGITQRAFRKLVHSLLSQLESIPDLLPKTLQTGRHLDALRQIHFPDSSDSLEMARRQLVLTEFFGLQLQVAQRRANTIALPGASHCGSGALLDQLLGSLPYALTDAQKRVIAEIRQDLTSSHPMNRLLQGDVGSGKTLVAMAAMLLAVEAGFQCALMAPTQILAEQHYLNFTRLLAPLGLNIALRTSNRREENTTLPLFDGVLANSPGSARVSRVDFGVSPKSEDGHRFRRRRLPHYERPYGIYALTFTTKNRRNLSAKSRDSVLAAVTHFHGTRYELYAACIMPDHVHLLLEPFVKDRLENGNLVFHSLTEITHSIKSFTAHQINQLENSKGAVWERESFDRLMRSDREADEKYDYILKNPIRANIIRPEEDYPWNWTQETALLRDAKEHTRGARAPAPPHILIGTHALLYDSVEFANLGLVVIDEQHKFGVLQRARLISRRPTPDVLVMTATPIPRTLTLTAYGDLDVSILDELPPGRGRILTELRTDGTLKDPAKFKDYLAAGHQAYIVCPLIDDSEKTDAKAATAELKKWSAFLAPLRCEMLHGRIPPAEKDAIMRRFRDNQIQALIATTVIEVGIDVPNATVMIIEDAEKFGLAQLHQLRGRIGRGRKTSYCILLTRSKEDIALKKLRALADTTDGFAIAEADLELRGPGDILGTAQSGLAPLKIGNILRDPDLMQTARQAATAIIQKDPTLSLEAHLPYRSLLITHSLQPTA